MLALYFHPERGCFSLLRRIGDAGIKIIPSGPKRQTANINAAEGKHYHELSPIGFDLMRPLSGEKRGRAAKELIEFPILRFTADLTNRWLNFVRESFSCSHSWLPLQPDRAQQKESVQDATAARTPYQDLAMLDINRI
jgi:hypothetical protein